jgi:hypothetical protein
MARFRVTCLSQRSPEHGLPSPCVTRGPLVGVFVGFGVGPGFFLCEWQERGLSPVAVELGTQSVSEAVVLQASSRSGF